MDGSRDAMLGFPHLRKAHCMFGWDWGPRIPDAGIHRSVRLIGYESGLIDSVQVLQYHEDGRVRLLFRPELKYAENKETAFLYKVTGPDGQTYETDRDTVIIGNSQLWWPRGYGEQSLYTVKAMLFVQRRACDVWEKRIGLRTLTMRREKDSWGESFATAGVVSWALRDADGKALRSGSCEVQVPALSSVWLEKMDFADADEYRQYFSYELKMNGEVSSQGSVLFCQPKHFHFRDPHLRAEIEGDRITVYADAYAKSVEIDCDDGDMVLSDNYFDMNAGYRTVQILRGTPGTLRLRSIYDIR